MDQEARRTLAEIGWCWATSRDDVGDILATFQEYQRSNEFDAKCFSLRAVVAEVRLTVKFFSQERLWPPWLMQPTDSLLKRIPGDEGSYIDYGNEMWEVMVDLMNLSSAMESVWHQENSMLLLTPSTAIKSTNLLLEATT